MFRSILCAAAFSVASFSSVAVETLDVLVVYDSNTISSVSKLNTDREREKYADILIENLKETFSNSGLSSHINFRLDNQIKTGFSNKISGKSENIEQIKDRYETSLISNAQSGDASGWLYTLQNAYKADVVIAVLKEGTSSGFCGQAIGIPSVSHMGGDTDNQVQEYAGYGLFFISATNTCLERESLVSHEFGHTAGLFHEPTSSAKSEMFVTGAAGYRNPWSSNFSTVMIQDSRQLSKRENQFSDKNTYGCGTVDNHYCGNTNSNAVATLKKYASQYNKRGNWYYDN